MRFGHNLTYRSIIVWYNFLFIFCLDKLILIILQELKFQSMHFYKQQLSLIYSLTNGKHRIQFWIIFKENHVFLGTKFSKCIKKTQSHPNYVHAFFLLHFSSYLWLTKCTKHTSIIHEFDNVFSSKFERREFDNKINLHKFILWVNPLCNVPHTLIKQPN